MKYRTVFQIISKSVWEGEYFSPIVQSYLAIISVTCFPKWRRWVSWPCSCSLEWNGHRRGACAAGLLLSAPPSCRQVTASKEEVSCQSAQHPRRFRWRPFGSVSSIHADPLESSYRPLSHAGHLTLLWSRFCPRLAARLKEIELTLAGIM